MILDTTFLIDLFRGNKAAVEKAAELDKKEEPVFATALSVFELWQGLDAKQKKAKVEQFVSAFGLLGFDVESAKKGGEIHAALAAGGIHIDPEDSMIAGVALHHAQAVLTRDEHFSRIKGLRVELY